MQMARNHGLMGPDTGSAALKIALSCRSRVIARAFRAEGPENGPQGTGMTAKSLGVSFCTQPELTRQTVFELRRCCAGSVQIVAPVSRSLQQFRFFICMALRSGCCRRAQEALARRCP